MKYHDEQTLLFASKILEDIDNNKEIDGMMNGLSIEQSMKLYELALLKEIVFVFNDIEKKIEDLRRAQDD